MVKKEKTEVLEGLSNSDVLASRKQHGTNTLTEKDTNSFIEACKELLLEPMLLLLLVTASVYFIMGRAGDGYFMLAAIGIVSGISLFQNARSRSALAALNNLTQPKCQVFRDGSLTEIKTEEIVIGDVVQVDEGRTIPADGEILRANDFSVNESILTGESLPVMKNEGKETVFQGTAVVSGLAIFKVTAIGNDTQLGKISGSLAAIVVPKTPLQIQINNFVGKMMLIGAVVFLAVWGINFYHTGVWLASLLNALTLAMSIIPEEIPVAFTTFMALGAWRLMKEGVLVKHTQTVETLGSSTVICTDKTGTITENKMALSHCYVHESDSIEDCKDAISKEAIELIEIAMWASEPIPFDPMEKALHEYYAAHTDKDERPAYELYFEYPLGGKPPMMTHVFQKSDGTRIIAAKGAPEALLAVSSLSESHKKTVLAAVEKLAVEGFRILGVGQASFNGDNFPKTQQEFKFEFKGLCAFYDPPKKNMAKVFEAFYRAGISVKIITGDSQATTANIAKQVGFKGYEDVIDGDAVIDMSEATLRKAVKEISLFVRMFPEAKLKVINALIANGEIVAMTGDGVNDAPALKAANIGVAMGERGSETAKQAASLVLIHDNFKAMVEAVAMGRRIYINLKKAIQYIISIHIPIILTVMVPLSLSWVYTAIFSPVHIIFLELLMGPTCSIIYENEPMEKDLMTQKPRPFTTTFFAWSELTTSILQGLVIALVTLGMYQYGLHTNADETTVRSLVFLTLISANVFLTFINRSVYDSVIASFRRVNSLIYIITGITVALTALIYNVPIISALFELSPLTSYQAMQAIAAGFVSVIWFEGVKWIKRIRARKRQ